jgi:hypothetical protein
MTAWRLGGYILVMSSYRNALPALQVDGQDYVEVRGSSTLNKALLSSSFDSQRVLTFSRVPHAVPAIMRHCYILAVLLLTQGRLAKVHICSRDVVHLLLNY